MQLCIQWMLKVGNGTDWTQSFPISRSATVSTSLLLPTLSWGSEDPQLLPLGVVLFWAPPEASSCRARCIHVASRSPSSLPLPVLIFPFRLHGDSPPQLACIPASAQDSELGLVHSSSKALVPAALSPPPGVNPPSFTVSLFF